MMAQHTWRSVLCLIPFKCIVGIGWIICTLNEQSGDRWGAKLVRGAYMEKERERAQEMKYPSPIHKTKRPPMADFDEAVNICLDHLLHISLCIASQSETE